jgi:hypothetical protein
MPLMKLVLAGAVGIPVLTAGAVAVTGLAVVDVRERHGGSRIVVPVPLALAQAAAAFVPERKTRFHVGHEAARYLPVARDVLEALGDAADGELVEVEEPGHRVSIVKEGGSLRVHVEDSDERVDVNVPIGAALAMLPDSDGRLTASAAVFALQHARYSKLVDVVGRDGERVKVTVY